MRLAETQQPDGSWPHRKGYDTETGTNYSLVETYRNLRVLVEMYGLHRAHPALQKAAEYLFSCQTVEGDIRGIIGNQYMPYYHGAILELLIKAGYADDPRVERGLAWLGFDPRDADVARGLDWFFSKQSTDGLWETGYGSGSRSRENRHWVGWGFVSRRPRQYWGCTLGRKSL